MQGTKILSRVIDFLSNAERNVLNKSLKVSKSVLEEAIKKKKNALEHLRIERERLVRDIDLEKDNLMLIKDSIKTIDQKIAQTETLIKDISEEVKAITDNTRELIKLRNDLASRPQADKFSVLMYTNIIQQNMSYAIELRKNITNLRKSIYDLELSKKNKEASLKKVQDKIKSLEEKRDKELPLKKANIETEIKTLISKKDGLSPVEVVQYPFSSLKPEKPKILLILVLSLFVGIILGIFTAFFVEFIQSNKERIIEDTQ